MKTIFKELKGLGFDYEKTMPRFLKNEDFYISCLQELLEEEGYVKLGELLEQEDVEQAFETAHTLKGITANMGITSIMEPLEALVEHLRNGQGNQAEAIYGELMQRKKQLDDIIRHER